MAVTTKKTFPATTNATTTVFSPVSIQLNNQDDLDVYVTLSGGTRVLQLRQSTGSTAQSSHPQVNNTDGLYFPAVSAGTTLYNYTLSSDNNTITFNSALPQGAVVFCERRTRDADSAYTTFASGSTIRATDLNNSSTESNFTAQDARNKALDLEGSIFGGIQPTIGGVAQPFVNSSKIIDGSIATADIADSAITSAKLADGTIVTGDIADGLVTTAKIAADAVTGAKIADDTLNSEHYAAGSIDTEHIADANVTTAKIADSNVTTAKIADANVTTAKIANDAINGTKIADDSINSEHYVDGSIDTAHIADSQVTTAKIADANVTAAKIATNAVTTDKIQDSELTTLAGMQSGTASILADSTALTATTAELNQLDGITLETSITTNSDQRIPTSKAVNDQILAVTNALGGFVAIADETSFPTSNPDPSNGAGTVVSISQVSSDSAVSINSSGVATIANGAGTGNTVTITGFPSNLQSQTLPASSGLQVQTTSTLHTYTFHKQLASAADIQAISATVNSFSNRYRVSASAPTSSLDGGDLWYDTTNSKLMVYSSQNSAWEESSAIGNFFISTISSSSNTGGGSATANGTAYRFTISDAPVSAQQLIVSVDGVIQKPNSGSSQPSEGFVLVGNDIIFGAAPANGASLFVTVIGSTVGIGTPSNNTVTTAILQNGSVTTAKIVDDAVTNAKIGASAVGRTEIANAAISSDKIDNGQITTAKLGDLAVSTAKLGDNAVTAAKLADTSVTAGSYGSSTSIPSITVDAQGRITAASGNTVNTDLVGDTSPQLGGDLDCNGKEILIDDNNAIKIGNSADLRLLHDGTHSEISNYTGTLYVLADSLFLGSRAAGEPYFKGFSNGAAELYYDTSKRLETTSYGIDVTGSIHSSGDLLVNDDNQKILIGGGNDLRIFHDGTDSYLRNETGELRVQADDFRVRNNANNQTQLYCNAGGQVELYYDNSKKFETTSNGAEITGRLTANEAFFNDNGSSASNLVTIQPDDQGPWALAIQNQAAGTEGYKSYIDNNGNYFSYLFGGGGTYTSRSIYVNNGSASKLMVKYAGGSVLGVELYQNGTKRFETTSSGNKTTGNLLFSGGTAAVNTICNANNNSIDICGSEYIYFRTNTTTERARLDTIGRFMIATTDTSLWNNTDAGSGWTFMPNVGCVAMKTDRATGYANFYINKTNTGSGSDERWISFGWNAADYGNIKRSGSGVNYSSNSDYRLKENVVTLTNGITRLKNLKPSRFNWISEPNVTVDGFIAHEAQTVVPEAVDGVKDQVANDSNVDKENGKPIYQKMDNAKLIPLLTAALQEAITKIETLETKVAALEAA